MARTEQRGLRIADCGLRIDSNYVAEFLVGVQYVNRLYLFALREDSGGKNESSHDLKYTTINQTKKMLMFMMSMSNTYT